MTAARVAFLSVVLALLCCGPFPVALAGEVALGALQLSYDDEVWEAERLVNGQLVRFTCISSDCPDDAGLFPDVYILARPISSNGWGSCDSAEPSLLTNDTEYSRFSFGRPTVAGIQFQITGLVSAWCRRRHPPPIIQACGVSEDTLYWMTTAFAGCSEEPDLPKARFDQILGGLSEGIASP